MKVNRTANRAVRRGGYVKSEGPIAIVVDWQLGLPKPGLPGQFSVSIEKCFEVLPARKRVSFIWLDLHHYRQFPTVR